MNTGVLVWAEYTFLSIVAMIMPFSLLYEFWKVWTSEKTGKGNKVMGARIAMVAGSITIIFMILVSMQIILLKILDFPYYVSGELPHFHGVVIEDRGIKGIQNPDTKEFLQEPDGYIACGIYNLKDNEVEVGEYVEVIYFPYSRGIIVIGEEIGQYKADGKEESRFETAERKVQGFGILWGLVLVISSSIWTYRTIQRRKKRFGGKIQADVIWRYEWVDKMSLILGTIPLIMAAATILGTWIFLWDNVICIRRLVFIFILIWMFGVLLEVFPYHSILTIQKETFQIGIVDFLKRVYKKSDIKEICYVNGKKMVIRLKNGRTINSWVSKELYNDVRERLIDGSEKAGNTVLRNNKERVYEGEEAKEFYQNYMKFWRNKMTVSEILWLIMLETTILTVICFRQDTHILIDIFYIIFINGIYLIVSLNIKGKRRPKLKKKYVCQLIFIEEFRERNNQVTYLLYEDGGEKKITKKKMEILGQIEKYGYATLVSPQEGEKEFIYFDSSWADLEDRSIK